MEVRSGIYRAGAARADLYSFTSTDHLGGGVMAQKQLFPLIRKKTASFLNGYIQTNEILEGIEEYIVPPGLGTQSGILGAKALAEDKLIGF